MASKRSFDVKSLIWRDPIPFSGSMGPTRTWTDPGEFTQEFNFSGKGDASGLRIAHELSSILRWPSGDQSPTQRWRLCMNVIGAKADWSIDLCLRWTPGHYSLELMEYSAATPLTDF
jgi:hypothetical protein